MQETVVAPIGARSQEVSWRAAANIVPAEPGRPRPRNQAAAGTGLPRRNSVLDFGLLSVGAAGGDKDKHGLFPGLIVFQF